MWNKKVKKAWFNFVVCKDLHCKPPAKLHTQVNHQIGFCFESLLKGHLCHLYEEVCGDFYHLRGISMWNILELASFRLCFDSHKLLTFLESFILHRMGRSHNLSMFLSEAVKSGTLDLDELVCWLKPWLLDTVCFFRTSICLKLMGNPIRFMVIPDMLKNAPMFKRLESRIKVPFLYMSLSLFFQLPSLVFWHISIDFVKGKGSALGVGRGRAVAMRARVSYLSHFIYAIFVNTINP